MMAYPKEMRKFTERTEKVVMMPIPCADRKCKSLNTVTMKLLVGKQCPTGNCPDTSYRHGNCLSQKKTKKKLKEPKGRWRRAES